jgi:hypothetical protein
MFAWKWKKIRAGASPLPDPELLKVETLSTLEKRSRWIQEV